MWHASKHILLKKFKFTPLNKVNFRDMAFKKSPLLSFGCGQPCPSWYTIWVSVHFHLFPHCVRKKALCAFKVVITSFSMYFPTVYERNSAFFWVLALGLPPFISRGCRSLNPCIWSSDYLFLHVFPYCVWKKPCLFLSPGTWPSSIYFSRLQTSKFIYLE